MHDLLIVELKTDTKIYNILYKYTLTKLLTEPQHVQYL